MLVCGEYGIHYYSNQLFIVFGGYNHVLLLSWYLCGRCVGGMMGACCGQESSQVANGMSN